MSKTIIKYLTGEGDIDGYHFGETVPGRPPFWWRFHLREYEAARDKEIDDLKSELLTAKKLLMTASYSCNHYTTEKIEDFLCK